MWPGQRQNYGDSLSLFSVKRQYCHLRLLKCQGQLEGKIERKNWNPMVARLFLFPFRIAVFWHESDSLASLSAGCCCLVNLSLSAKQHICLIWDCIVDYRLDSHIFKISWLMYMYRYWQAPNHIKMKKCEDKLCNAHRKLFYVTDIILLCLIEFIQIKDNIFFIWIWLSCSLKTALGY